MARVTVEDCIDKVDNRFDLVLLAAHRARMISSGSQLTVDRDNDKNPVVSLREIAESSISPGGFKGRAGAFPAEVRRGRRARTRHRAADRLGRRQRRCRRHRGRGRAHDRGGAAQGPRGPGAPGGAARKKTSNPARQHRNFTKRPGQLFGPLLLLTFFWLGCVLSTAVEPSMPGWVHFGSGHRMTGVQQAYGAAIAGGESNGVLASQSTADAGRDRAGCGVAGDCASPAGQAARRHRCGNTTWLRKSVPTTRTPTRICSTAPMSMP